MGNIKLKHHIPFLGVEGEQFWIDELHVRLMLDLVCELFQKHRTDLIPKKAPKCIKDNYIFVEHQFSKMRSL